MTDELKKLDATEPDATQLMKAQSFVIKTIIAVLDARDPETHLADELRSAGERHGHSDAFRDALNSILPPPRH